MTQGHDLSEQASTATDIAERGAAVLEEVHRHVVGLRPVSTLALATVLAGGHVLFEDLPGLGKTMLCKAMSTALGLEFRRIQGTPDLMPSDITGSSIFDPAEREFQFHPGPVFTGLLLADEINRTSPKTQSALLEAMEERQVTVDGSSRSLPDPFIVAATQNPVEFEGTYPLPEAQLDRFLMKIRIDLPRRDDEIEVLNRHAHGFDPRDLAAAGLQAVAGPADLAEARRRVGTVQIHPQVLGYIVDVVRATRQSPSLQIGVSPRGSTALMNTAKTWAWLSGRDYVSPDDVKVLAFPTLRHRVSLRPEAEMDGVSADAVIESILASVPVPR